LILALVAGLLLASAASAQEAQGFKGLSSSDLKRYCIFADQLYSEGAVFCSAKHHVAVCGKDGVWVGGSQEKLDPLFCNENHSLTPMAPQFQ
jgi:hypothetical protein